jgi:hypothetical protein
MLPKKTVTKFSDWEYVGNGVLKAIAKWKKGCQKDFLIRGSQVYAILVVAVNPDALAHAGE